jgi:hypothetical protein
MYYHNSTVYVFIGLLLEVAAAGKSILSAFRYEMN